MMRSFTYAELLAAVPVEHMPETFRNLGARVAYDYTGEGSSFKKRLTRCYELAGLAAANTLAGNEVLLDGQPVPEALIHGRWQGPEPKAIGHAWVRLSNGDIWEPISACICDADTFYAYSKGVVEEEYSLQAAAMNMITIGHFGPWHEREGD